MRSCCIREDDLLIQLEKFAKILLYVTLNRIINRLMLVKIDSIMPSISVYDVYPSQLITAVAEKLKKIPGVTPPDASKFWKTASFKEKAPIDQENFWFIRCASLLRKLYVNQEIGINKLRKEYGGRDKNHVHKKHKKPGSGAIIRRCLQQLQGVNLVKSTEKGRVLTPAGISLLDKTALEIYKENPISRFSELSE